ncbi:hypothetical protein, partial [Halorubrum rubrum]|uniref:hypothetical protein n=1 Tax=Halorubrum rubrum TaxID=1126240 RepID=UPI002111FE2E
IFTRKYFLIACFRNHAVEHLRITNSTMLGRILHAKVDTLCQAVNIGSRFRNRTPSRPGRAVRRATPI